MLKPKVELHLKAMSDKFCSWLRSKEVTEAPVKSETETAA